jgi:hypothetical protein
VSLRVLDEADVTRIVRAELARPELVHQRNVETVIGLPRHDYLRLARAKAWPSTHEKRLVVSRTKDVVAYYESRISLREQKPVNDADPEAVALARVGARRIAQ